MTLLEGMIAPYDENDPIFELSEEINRQEQEKIATECRICKKPHAKLKNW